MSQGRLFACPAGRGKAAGQSLRHGGPSEKRQVSTSWLMRAVPGKEHLAATTHPAHAGVGEGDPSCSVLSPSPRLIPFSRYLPVGGDFHHMTTGGRPG